MANKPKEIKVCKIWRLEFQKARLGPSNFVQKRPQKVTEIAGNVCQNF